MGHPLMQSLDSSLERVDAALEDRDRLAQVGRVLSRPHSPESDEIVRDVAARIDVPWAGLTVLDSQVMHFMSTSDGPMTSCPLDGSKCQYVIATGASLAIDNAHAGIWRRLIRSVVSGIVVEAYLGVPLVIGGETVGALCIVDDHPRHWTAEEHFMLVRACQKIAELLA